MYEWSTIFIDHTLIPFRETSKHMCKEISFLSVAREISSRLDHVCSHYDDHINKQNAISLFNCTRMPLSILQHFINFSGNIPIALYSSLYKDASVTKNLILPQKCANFFFWFFELSGPKESRWDTFELTQTLQRVLGSHFKFGGKFKFFKLLHKTQQYGCLWTPMDLSN